MSDPRPNSGMGARRDHDPYCSYHEWPEGKTILCSSLEGHATPHALVNVPDWQSVQELAYRRIAFQNKRAKNLGIQEACYSALRVFFESWHRGFLCHYCNRKMLTWDNPPYMSLASLDHAIPLSKGGTNKNDNFRIACFGCNTAKGVTSESEWLRIAQIGALDRPAFDTQLLAILRNRSKGFCWICRKEPKPVEALIDCGSGHTIHLQPCIAPYSPFCMDCMLPGPTRQKHAAAATGGAR